MCRSTWQPAPPDRRPGLAVAALAGRNDATPPTAEFVSIGSARTARVDMLNTALPFPGEEPATRIDELPTDSRSRPHRATGRTGGCGRHLAPAQHRRQVHGKGRSGDAGSHADELAGDRRSAGAVCDRPLRRQWHARRARHAADTVRVEHEHRLPGPTAAVVRREAKDSSARRCCRCAIWSTPASSTSCAISTRVQACTVRRPGRLWQSPSGSAGGAPAFRARPGSCGRAAEVARTASPRCATAQVPRSRLPRAECSQSRRCRF